jgi:hypothetical protein
MSGHERTYHFAHDRDEPWRSVVDAVSFVTGVDPLDMEPLYESVDPDLLASLPGSDGSVSFEMEGTTVTVEGAGEIRVEAPVGPTSVQDRLGDDGTVLLLAEERRGDEACADLLLGDSSDQVDALGITFATTPGDRVSAWQAEDAAEPASTAFVEVEHPTRSNAAPDGGTSRVETADAVSVDHVRDATDLARLGETITDRVSQLAERARPTALCFHSLTDLLMHVDDADAFRFVHILSEQLASAGVPAHFHADPAAHDRATVRTFEPLFDAVVEVDATGDWIVTTDTDVGS